MRWVMYYLIKLAFYKGYARAKYTRWRRERRDRRREVDRFEGRP